MVKSMVVVLDKTKSSTIAQQVSISLAAQINAELVGLSVVDAPWIATPRATPIGASHYQAQRNTTLLAKGREGGRTLLDTFEAACKSANVRFTCQRRRKNRPVGGVKVYHWRP